MSRGRETRNQKPETRMWQIVSAFWLLVSGLFLVAGCRQKMSNQPSYRPLEPSLFWADGMSARPRIAGTVARGELAVGGFLATGRINGQDGDGFPFPVTEPVMNR